jgi:hypothetical protein
MIRLVVGELLESPPLARRAFGFLELKLSVR